MAKTCEYIGTEVEQSHCDYHLTCTRCLSARRGKLEAQVYALTCQLATVTAERDELASDIVRLKEHLEAAERVAKANWEEAKAANERAKLLEVSLDTQRGHTMRLRERAERSEARAKGMRSALEMVDRRIRDIVARKGGPSWSDAKAMMKADIDLIHDGVCEALKEASND